MIFLAISGEGPAGAGAGFLANNEMPFASGFAAGFNVPTGGGSHL